MSELEKEKSAIPDDAAGAAMADLGDLQEEIEAAYGQVVEPAPSAPEGCEEQRRALGESEDRYKRLYAEFENFKKRVTREKQELANHAHESVLYELLPSVDNLEAALKHASEGPADSLLLGVEVTLKEFLRTLEKFGLKPIFALNRTFDPAYHHAVSQVERADIAPGVVVEEFRKGFLFRDRVLRASMVVVSKRPEAPPADENDKTENTDTTDIKEES